MAENNSTRLAKNTIFMYVRMFVLLVISLYTSRVLLKQLGVEDFGIYNLVGSIIAMLSSLRGLFSASTQRFLNYEMGKNNTSQLQVIFNMSILINLAISVIFVLSVEIIGFWFLNYKINIDPSRLTAATWVFQLSVISSVITIMTTSYDAVIIANERMKFFAYSSVLEGVLKLAIVFLLGVCSYDKLIFYAILLLIVSIIVRFVNAIYCKVNFPESHYKKCWDGELFKKMSSFAGWNFFGNLGFSLSNEGINMILNVFGGPVVNAARGIAYQIRAAIYMFLGNVNKAIDPYSTKLYAQGENEKFFKTMYFSTKVLFTVSLCITIPLFFFTESVISIWLGEIPPYSVVFVRLILVMGLLKSFFAPIDVLFLAANKLKHYQLVNICVSGLTVFFSWLLLSLGSPCYSVFIVAIITSFLSLTAFIVIASKECELNILDYFKHVVIKVIMTIGVVAMLGYFINLSYCRTDLLIIFINITIMILIAAIISYLLTFENEEKQMIRLIIKNILH